MSRYAVVLVSTLLLCSDPGVRADDPPPAKNAVVVNSIGMKLVPIPAGEFLMGSPDSDKDALDDEKPRHKVKITRPFLMGQYHVTVGEFRQFIKDTGYRTVADKAGSTFRTIRPDGKIEVGKAGQNWENIGFPITDSHPVCCVDFEDCVEFCKWLSKKEGKTYRLPTEAEWEYACRAGTTTRWSCGDNKDALADHANIVYDTFPTFARGNSPKFMNPRKLGWVFMAPVGQFKANPWGLHDMHGNLWQWCSDWYGEDYYQHSPAADPKGPAEGDARVIRGGVWSRGPLDCRSANRSPLSGATSLGVGFRVVCDVSPSDAEAKELAKLQGIWITEYTEHDGVRDRPDSRHVIVGNRYFRIDDGQVEEDGVIKIDLSGPVKKIDYICVKGVYEGKTWKGIYRIDGDTYRHFGPFGTVRWENRPAAFADKTNAETWLRVMKRESK